MKKMFTKFGVEPTFYFNLKVLNIPDFLKDQLEDDNIQENAAEIIAFKKTLKDKHHWMLKAYEDSCNLEVPSPQYTDKRLFIKDYSKLVSFLKNEFQFLPSSVVDIETEGGCHFNVSIPNEIKNANFAPTFFKNLQYYLRNHPSILWAFLAPTDNQSSVVSYNKDPRNNTKGEFFTVRDDDNELLRVHYYGYEYGSDYNDEIDYKDNRNRIKYFKYKKAQRIELRFFMQPQTVEEMELEVDFGLHLLNWMWQQTERGIVFKPKTKREDVRAYAKNKAKTLKEIKTVCQEMEFPYKRLVECGRIENLKTKFQYQDKYFV